MAMTIEEYNARFPGRRQPIPAEYAGEWIAWNNDQSEILAHGKVLAEVRQQAVDRGCSRPVLQKVSRGPFVGLS